MKNPLRNWQALLLYLIACWVVRNGPDQYQNMRSYYRALAFAYDRETEETNVDTIDDFLVRCHSESLLYRPLREDLK